MTHAPHLPSLAALRSFETAARHESFHPGEVGITAVTKQSREELFSIFPELRALPRSYGPAARRSLKRHEARLLL